MRSFFIISLTVAGIFILNSAAGQIAAIKFTVKVPGPSEKVRTVYLAGSFNGWNARDSFYIMNSEGENSYSLVVPLFEGKNYQYKYTLGSWNTVEIKDNDSNITNRKLCSRNGASVYDTVLKWKLAPAETAKTVSPQLQKMITMKDSIVAKMKVMLGDLLVLLKQYNENMLAPSPDVRLHKKINKETTEIISKAYLAIEELVWQAGTSLSNEQKQKILEAIKNSRDTKDPLNNIINAYATVLK